MNKLKKFGILFVILLLVVLPLVGFAQESNPNTVSDQCQRTIRPADQFSQGGPTIATVICYVGYYLNVIIPVLIALAVVYFIWGVVQYVVGADEEAKSKGRDKIIFGLIGLAVIVSVWGLVSILRRSFGIRSESEINIPCIPGVGVDCPTG